MEEENKTYSKDHVLVMFEEIKSQGKIVIEQYADLTGKVDLILEDIDEIKSDVVDMKIRLDSIDEKLVSKVEKEITDDHEKRISKLEKTVLATA